MDYLDFELCIGKGEGRLYPLSVVRSPAGEQKATMEFPLDELELRDRLQTLQIALLKSGSTRRDLVRPEEHTSVEDFGRTLFGALLPEEIRSSYRLSREKAKQAGKGLRLRLRIEAPDLAALPWEFLYDDAEGDFVCLSSDTPIVRYLDLDRPSETVAIEPPLRILGMIASPGDRSALDVEREKGRMTEALADLEATGRVAVTWLEGQTWRDLQRAMRQGPWHVFHFVGHGGFDAASGEGLLALADEDGGTFHLPATQLGRLLADHRSLRLAVLNACEGAQASDTDLFSSTASVLIRRGIPAVVAMQYEITDRAAIEFSHEFYQSIAEGLPVDASVAEARKAVSLSSANTVEWGTPVLHMRAPDGRLFDIDPAHLPPASDPEAPSEADGPEATRVSPERTRASATPRARAPLALWAGVAALAGVLAVAAWFLLSRGDPEASNAPITSIILSLDADMVLQGDSTTIRTSVLDSTGTRLSPAALQGIALEWGTGDSTIAVLHPVDGSPLTATLKGLSPGTTELRVGFADTGGRFPRRVAGKALVTVLPGDDGSAAAFQAYNAASDAFGERDSTDQGVLALYRDLLATHRGTLRDLDPARLERIETRTAALERLIAAHDAAVRQTASGALSTGDAIATWTGFLDLADTVRKSPATTRATAAVRALEQQVEEDSPVSGTYRVQVKATSRYLHVDGFDGADQLLSTRHQVDDDFTRFLLEPQPDGSHRIQVKATGRHLHVDGLGDRLVSTRTVENDDYTRFYVERQADGSYRLRVKATGRYLHVDGLGDRLVSTRAEENDDYTRFYLIRSR